MKFLKASFQGWIYCRDHQTDCVNIVLKNGSLLGRGHQTWQMNEINALIWPSPRGIGLPPAGAVAQTAAIAKKYGVIKKAPTRRDELHVRGEGRRAAQGAWRRRQGRQVEDRGRQGDARRKVTRGVGSGSVAADPGLSSDQGVK